MKKIYILLVLLVQLFMVENVLAQCTHTIALTDTYGDGWNGGAVSVSVNGTVVLTNITLGAGFGPANFNFTASAGQTIRVYTTIAGSYASERRIRVVNSTGVQVIALIGVANGTATTGGRVGTAVCPPPCASNNVNLNITGGTYPGEVSWTLVNPSGTTVASGGAPYNQNLCLPTGCYTFNMVDSWGDGWNGANYTFTLGGTSIGTGTLVTGASGSAQIGVGTSCAPPSPTAPCTNLTAFGTLAAPTVPGAQTISTCTYQNEYNTITGIVAGQSYTIGSSCGGYISVRRDTPGGTVVGHGAAPYTFTAPTSGTYYIHYNTNSSCGTATNCCTTTITCNSCTPAGPANDLVCNAASITCGGTVSGTTVGSGNAGTGENQTCGIGQTMGGVWYVVPGNGQIMTASLCGTVWDSKISVFSGPNCSTLTCVGGTDDNGPACGTTSASYSWTSVVGQNYYILVHGYSSDLAFSLALTCASPPPADPTGITSSNASICSGAGTNVTLTATGASGTVYWFTGTCATTGQIATGNSIVVSPTATTTYFARNYNGSAFSNNCASFTLTVNPLPTINAGTGGTICAGNNIQLNASSTSQTNGTLSTIFTGGNGCGAGNMFDLVAGPAPVTVNGFSLNPSVTGAQTVNVYYRVGTHVGNTTNIAAWTLLGAYTLNGTAATASYMATGNIVIPAGATYGIYVQYNANYTDGNGTNQTYSNANLTLNAGVGHCTGFDGCCAPRVFNGIVHYTVGATPTFSWSPSASLSSSSILNPVATPATTTTYTVTATANGCSASSNVTVTVNSASTAPTLSGAGIICPNTTVNLVASGGTAGAGSQVAWYTGPNGTGSFLGFGNSFSFVPTASSIVYARREGTCNTTADASTSITIRDYVYAANNTSSTNYCTDNSGWNHFYDGNNIILSVRGNLSSAGTVTALIRDNATYFSDPGNAALCATGGNPGEAQFEMQRSWNVSYTGTLSGTYEVRYYFAPQERQDVIDAAAAFMAANPGCAYNYKYNPGNNGWFWFKNNNVAYTAPSFDDNPNFAIMTSTVPGTTPNGLTYTEISGITGFSGGTGAIILAPNAALPVELISFSANCNETGDKVNVNWSTASEYNSSHFFISRSTDGVNWENINTQNAAINSTTIQEYGFVDLDVRGYNKIYYKLTQVDMDGMQNVYNVVVANCHQNGVPTIITYPNPSSNDFTIDFGGSEMKGDVQLSIMNTEGKEISNREINLEEGVNTYQINNMELQPGIYYLKIVDTTGRLFIIKHSFI